MEHKVLVTLGRRSWLDGFDPVDVRGCVVLACVLEDNTVALLKFLPTDCVMDQK